MFDPRRQQAWQMLELGPHWVPRARSGPAPADQAPPPVVASSVTSPVAPAALATWPDWESLQQAVSGCRACGLCEGRTQTVFGTGSTSARWLLVGEGPGREEDLKGEPFVGQAGRLLDRMLIAAGLDRARDVYIANTVKCRPPNNRTPEAAEIAACEPFLAAQIRLLQPQIVLALGRPAAQTLLKSDASISSLRGRVHEFSFEGRSVPLVCTYHPAYLLRTPADKRKAWEDLCLAVDALARADAHA